jgi:hypothetical protein
VRTAVGQPDKLLRLAKNGHQKPKFMQIELSPDGIYQSIAQKRSRLNLTNISSILFITSPNCLVVLLIR